MLRMSWVPQHLRVICPRQHQGRFGFLCVRRAFEQQAGGGDVADRQQALRPLQQRRKFIRIDAPCRRRRGGAAATGGSRVTGSTATTLLLSARLIGGGDFVARRRGGRQCGGGLETAGGRTRPALRRRFGIRRLGDDGRWRCCSFRLRSAELDGCRAGKRGLGVDDDGAMSSRSKTARKRRRSRTAQGRPLRMRDAHGFFRLAGSERIFGGFLVVLLG